MSKFSERFKELKDKSHLTLKDISEELGVSVPNLSYYMKGREPNYDSLCAIADFFEVTTDYLLGRSDYRTYEEELKVKSTQEELSQFGIQIVIDEDVENDITQITLLSETFKKKLISLLPDDAHDRKDIIDIADEFINLIYYLLDLKPMLYTDAANRSRLFKSNDLYFNALISAYSTLISLNGTIKGKLFKLMCDALKNNNVSESNKNDILAIFEGLCVDKTFCPSPGRRYYPVK